ncbi:NACHT, LRR and PYD domains-containing protein 3-like [Sinocyclocheilus grahami]|uniref:NACHT, LRR and PYD domains-containing protein 3-like n=1 Tax=Sinocyclocheilus grahami TaxID=75366 RepID=UPI0007ACE142|nr:PREDICTED: NACHT, LRR and PYD domains-containing protein 3-like [Sinocyclocheilus grahami]
MKQDEDANTLEDELIFVHQLKCSLKKKYQCVFEGIAKQGDSTLLNNIYTDLYITQGGSEQVNTEHEVRQIEVTSRHSESQEIQIECTNMFEAPEQDKQVRTVLTKGVAGIGKSVSVQKFVLDWAEGKENQNISFIFPLPFREMNLKEKEKQSLLDLITQFFPETKGLNIARRNQKVLFILDGLDEFRLPLKFDVNETWSDVSSPASLDVLLTNLIKGNLLPSALIWITTRPAAASKIPSDYIDRLTEVRGFNDAQKEEYFKKRFEDQNQAKEIIDHVKQSKSLFIMCHIPVVCWISATVLQNILFEKRNNDLKNYQGDDASKTLQESNTEDTPKTLTQMYTHFLRFQIQQSRRKYDGEYTPDTAMDNALKSTNGHQDPFLHLLFVLLLQPKSPKNMIDLLKTAVDKALESDNGHLDLFLRFLLGLSLQSNRLLLRGLLTQQDDNDQSKKEIVQYIKQKLEANLSPERSINLFYCLNELNDQTLVKDIQTHLSKGSLSSSDLSPAQWSALTFVLLTSEEELEEFELQKFKKSDECLTLTQMYTHFLRFQIQQSRRKYDGEYTPDVSWDKDAILSLGKLAFQQLERNNLIFYDTDLEACGIDVYKASVYSGMCTQIFKEETGIILGTMYCFVHLSIQEFIAALYAHLFLDINKKSVFGYDPTMTDFLKTAMDNALKSTNGHQDPFLHLLFVLLLQPKSPKNMIDLLKTAVDKALESDNGHLDLFLRFLLGLSLQSNRLLLRGLLTQQDDNDQSKKEIVQYIKQKLEANLSPERSINLFYCLNELNDQTLVKDIQTHLSKGSLSSSDLSPAQWSALTFVLLTSEEELEEFELQKFKKSDECLVRLLSVIKTSKRALLNDCDLTDRSCSALATILGSDTNLKELNMNNNNLQDSGVKLLCTGLENIKCELEILR